MRKYTQKDNLKKRMDHRNPANILFIACPALLILGVVFGFLSHLLGPSAVQPVAPETENR